MDSLEVRDQEVEDACNVVNVNALPYETDQWSPFSKNGKKVYSQEFLMSLRNDPKSKEKPKNIPAALVVANKKLSKNKNALIKQLVANSNYDYIQVKISSLQSSELSPVDENTCSSVDTELISFVDDQPSIENKNTLPNKINIDSNRKEFNLDDATDDLAKVKKSLQSNKNINNSPVSELQNKNKNPSQEQTTPPVQKPNAVSSANAGQKFLKAQVAGDLGISQKPIGQTIQTITAPSSKVMVQQPPAGNKTPLRALTYNVYAGAPLSRQTPHIANHQQGQVMYQTTPAPFRPVLLQPALHYGNPSTTMQYFGSGGINYVHPGYQMHLTQGTVYQHPPQGVLGGPQASKQTHPNSNQLMEGALMSSGTYHSMNVLEEYLNNHLSIEEVEQKIKTSTSPLARPQLITDGCLSVLETSKLNRLQTGYLFGKLVKRGILSVEDYCGSLEVVLKKADELVIDVPRVWDYLAELVFPVLCEGAIEMKNLHKLFNLLVQKPHAAKLLTRLFKLMITGNEENSTLSFADYTNVATNALKIPSPIPSPPVEPISDPPQAQLNKGLEKYLNDRYSVQGCLQHIKSSISPSEMSQLVSLGSMSVLKKSKMCRLRLGFLFGQLLKLDILSISDYCIGLESIFKQADQLVIDVPKVWSSVAELISPVMCENAVTLRDLHNLFKLLGSNNNHAPELLKCLFKLIIQEKSIIFLQSVWNNSNLTFGDYMDESEVANFVKTNNFEFLLKTDASTLSPGHYKPLTIQSNKVKTSILKPVQHPPLVPPPQLSKPTVKTNKFLDVIFKGGSQERTDVDAFKNNVVVENAANAYPTTSASSLTSSDYLNNFNTITMNDNINIIDSLNVMNDSNKQAESNDMSTIKPLEIKTLSKKVEVVDIFKDLPQPIKPIIVPNPAESQGKPDHATLTNDKMGQAKNETNAKASTDTKAETKINLPYKDGQWSPYNRDGKKVYDRDFLLALRKDPKSNKKPDNLPAHILAPEDRGLKKSLPNKKSSQRGAPPKRKSQQSSTGAKGGKQSVSFSADENIKLHETEQMPVETMTEYEKKTEELYMKVQDILDTDFTPENIDATLDQAQSLSIDTRERLQGVMDLVFKKAMDEPHFSVVYASLCRELELMVPAAASKEKVQEFVNVEKLLLSRCQLAFEKKLIDEMEGSSKTKEKEDNNDVDKKKDMYDQRLRINSVAFMKFIGELFKQDMLSCNIILRCLINLLDTNDEESLECLCQLLTTAGPELVTKKVELSAIFAKMKVIADEKPARISSRVRLLIQNIIDHQASQWQDLNPNTVNQIQEEAQHQPEPIIQACDTPSPHENLSSEGIHPLYKEVYDKLLEFFNSGASWLEIKVWITQNIGERVKDDQFIRALATACFEDSVVNLKFKPDNLKKKYGLLLHFVKKKPSYELQCLHALQGFIDKLQHPPGLLLAICNRLYYEHVFSKSSFLAWKATNQSSRRDATVKAMKQLTSFFAELSEHEGNSSSSED